MSQSFCLFMGSLKKFDRQNICSCTTNENAFFPSDISVRYVTVIPQICNQPLYFANDTSRFQQTGVLQPSTPEEII